MSDASLTTLATHSGCFHADDVMAYATLSLALGQRGVRHELTRTRDPQAIAAADIAFDVGGECRPEQGRYDHHMRNRPQREDGVAYSSAGLIWRDFGRDALRAMTVLPADAERAESVLDELWANIDEYLVRPIDLVDNGVLVPSPTDLTTLIDAFNPSWDKAPKDRVAAEQSEDRAFYQAVEVMHGFLARRVDQLMAVVRAEDIVLEAYARSADPRVLELPQGMPWIGAAYKHELPVLFAAFEDGGMFYLRCNPETPDSFTNKQDLPEAWRGLRDGALVAETGIADAAFCHPNLFIAGARSRDGLTAMIAQALAASPAPVCR